MLRRIDPVIRLLIGAILLATALPVTGAAREVAQGISNAAVFTLFLLYGLRLPRREVLAGLGNHRFLVPLVLWVFGAMSLAGWLLWHMAGFLVPPLVALGFLYLGVLPSTVQSASVYSSLAGGNVASSVVAAGVLNIASVFISAPLFSLLAGVKGYGGFQGDTVVKVLTMLLLPFVLGQILQRWAGAWVKGHRQLVTVLDRASIGIAVYVAFSGAVEQDIWHRVGLTEWGWILIGVGVMLAFGYGGAWLLGGAVGLDRGTRIAMLFAGAQKSIAVGAPLAVLLFSSTMAGIVLLPVLVYHLAQMVVAAPVAARLARATPGDP